MKYLKMFEEYSCLNEDFRIIKSIPKYFYIVLKDKELTFESLSKGYFENLIGISDSPEIIKLWLDIRPILLIMSGEDFIKLNKNYHKIDYSNPNQIISKNFRILNRLLNNQDLYLYDVIQKIFTGAEHFESDNDNYDRLTSLLNYNVYKISDIIRNEISRGKIINNIWDLVNIIWKNLSDIIDNHNVSNSFRKPHNIEDYDRNLLYYVLQQGILDTCKGMAKEGEWILSNKHLNDKLYIPKKSKLMIKLTVADDDDHIKDYKYPHLVNGLENETLENVKEYIKKYKLSNKYDINFVNGYLRIYDLFKDNPAPNIIPYKKLINMEKVD